MPRQLNRHEFFGIEYRPCTYRDSLVAGYRWYRVSHHRPSGMEYSEQHCEKFRTLRDCRDDARYCSDMRSVVAEQEPTRCQ